MSIYQLIYTSEAVQPLSDRHLTAMLAKARAYNHRQAITGMLLYSDGRFMQVLEGQTDEVELLYQKIKQDPRHRALRVLHQDLVRQRHFSDWKMGFRRQETGDEQRAVGFSDLLRNDSPASRAFRTSAGTAHRMLLGFGQIGKQAGAIQTRDTCGF